MEKIITLKNVSKIYNNKLILENINLTIKQGETLFIEGINGSGKSTLLRVIAGLTSISNGKRIINDKLEFKLAYVPDNFPKLPLTCTEYLNCMGKIDGLSKDNIRNRMNFLFKIFSMPDNFKNVKIRDLSKGTIQKISIIQAILINPTMLILDEPFSGLDKESQEKLFLLLQNLQNDKVAIVFTNHEKEYNKLLINNIIKVNNSKIEFSNSNDNPYDIIITQIGQKCDFDLIKKLNGILRIKKYEEIYYIYTETMYSDEILYNILKLGGSICSFQKNGYNNSLKGGTDYDC